MDQIKISVTLKSKNVRILKSVLNKNHWDQYFKKKIKKNLIEAYKTFEER